MKPLLSNWVIVLTLFISKASILVVCLWVLKVYLLMGNIHVTTYDNGLNSIESVKISLERLLPTSYE